jgi:hypothetical protein
MAETLYLDYAWERPSPAAIRNAGFSGVMRYISHDPSKDLTQSEAAALRAAGLAIALVWETSATRAGEGQAAGRQDGAAAEAAATALGYPLDAVIFYAVDYDTGPTAVMPYFNGVREVAHHPVGVYGSCHVVDGLRASGVPYGWQTAAWSAGVVSAHAHLYQRVAMTHPVPGSDENVLLGSFPAWGSSGPTPPIPPRPPQQLVVDGQLGPASISRWQAVMGTPVDGVISPVSALIVAVQRFLSSQLVADGQFGPRTISKLQQYLETPVDGTITLPVSQMVKALQRALNTARTGSKRF